jgi:hypothetical protein
MVRIQLYLKSLRIKAIRTVCAPSPQESRRDKVEISEGEEVLRPGVNALSIAGLRANKDLH